MSIFFSDKQIWYITHGLFIPVTCIFLSYYLGKLDIKMIKNPGLKSILMGTIRNLCILYNLLFFFFFLYKKN